MARDFDRQAAELPVRAAILNRFTRLGTRRRWPWPNSACEKGHYAFSLFEQQSRVHVFARQHKNSQHMAHATCNVDPPLASDLEFDRRAVRANEGLNSISIRTNVTGQFNGLRNNVAEVCIGDRVPQCPVTVY